jgi:hypothetical protein
MMAFYVELGGIAMLERLYSLNHGFFKLWVPNPQGS